MGDKETIKESSPKFECLLFDLDDTIYPSSSGMSTACGKNITDFLVEKMGMDPQVAPQLCRELYKTYGTTMAGLVARGYKFDFDEYHSYAHGRLPYHVLKPDPVLREMLLSMPQRKLVLTNGDKIHASKALSRMGLEDCFEHAICFETFNPTHNFNTSVPVICKPSVEAFRRAIQVAGVDPSKTLFFDDSPRNLQGAKAAGMHTVLVGSSTKVDGADYAIESIRNMREAFPELWQEKDVPSTKQHHYWRGFLQKLHIGKL